MIDRRSSKPTAQTGRRLPRTPGNCQAVQFSRSAPQPRSPGAYVTGMPRRCAASLSIFAVPAAGCAMSLQWGAAANASASTMPVVGINTRALPTCRHTHITGHTQMMQISDCHQACIGLVKLSAYMASQGVVADRLSRATCQLQYIQHFQKTTEKTWQIKKKQIQKQLYELSEKEFFERDQKTKEIGKFKI